MWGKKSDAVLPLENKYSSEGDSLKWASKGCPNSGTCPGLLLFLRACQALSKFSTVEHTTSLACNVLLLTHYTAGYSLSLPHFLREALDNQWTWFRRRDPNQGGLLPALGYHLLNLCIFPSEHLQHVLFLLVQEMLIH